MAVDPNYASWLKSEAMFRSWTNSGLPSGLQAMAIDSEIITPFAASAAADTELTRQGALLDGPLALDSVTCCGRRVDLVGKCITLSGDQLNYSAGVNVLVIQANEQEDGTTQLLVLRAL
jgi:hypothetical protein